MKTKKFLVLLALGCFCSCQQSDDNITSKKEVINFTTSIDNSGIQQLLTRADGINAGKTSFNEGDIISMASENEQFSSFTIGKDVRTWSEIDNQSNETKFYAHYPQLASYEYNVSSQREVSDNQERLFGVAEVPTGSTNAVLKFKRMTIPVILRDSKGNPYNGDAQIVLHVKNRGIQDLKKGEILPVGKDLSDVVVKKLSDGIATNLIPQTIEAGQKIATITQRGITKDVISPRTMTLTAGGALNITLNFVDGDWIIIIDEGQVPL